MKADGLGASRRAGDFYDEAMHAADCDLTAWEAAFEAQTGSPPSRRLYEAKRKEFEFARLSSYGLFSQRA